MDDVPGESRRGPRVIEVLLMLAAPLAILWLDLESMRASGGRSWLNRARATISRKLRP